MQHAPLSVFTMSFSQERLPRAAHRTSVWTQDASAFLHSPRCAFCVLRPFDLGMNDLQLHSSNSAPPTFQALVHMTIFRRNDLVGENQSHTKTKLCSCPLLCCDPHKPPLCFWPDAPVSGPSRQLALEAWGPPLVVFRAASDPHPLPSEGGAGPHLSYLSLWYLFMDLAQCFQDRSL